MKEPGMQQENENDPRWHLRTLKNIFSKSTPNCVDSACRSVIRRCPALRPRAARRPPQVHR
jgi:hypothetical protein